MKRSIGTLAALILAAAAFAQAPFTIVRPADGSKVRETVRVLIPKNSVPEGGYVGVYVNGKFLEATVLDLKGEFCEYLLDTKGKKLPDGRSRIEMVLFGEAGDRARVLDRSSVDVTIANSASIKVPDDGFQLRYRFRRGTEYVYKTLYSTTVLTISEAQARSGGRAASLPVDTDNFRMLYAVDNTYSDGDGLVRSQALPNWGKDYTFFSRVVGPDGEMLEGKKYYSYEMHPVYMRLTNTGLEKFGSIPLYVPLEGTAGEPSRTDLFALFPLPTLPVKGVKPGDAWQGRFQIGALDFERIADIRNVAAKVPARGELQGVEWEMGHPCAKVRYSIAEARLPAPKGADGGQGMGGDRVSMNQTVWFAMDMGMPVKMALDITRDVRIAVQAQPQGGQAGPTAGGAGGQIQGVAGTAGSGGGGRGGPPPGSINQGRRGPGPQGGRGGVDDPADEQGGAGRFGGQGRQGAPAGGAQTQYMRVRTYIQLTLEQ